MKRLLSLVALAATIVVASGGATLAAGFSCPAPLLVGVPGQPANIGALLPGGDALDDVEKLNAALTKLRQEGVAQAVIIDRLIAAYCQAMVSTPGIDDAQRTTRTRNFASRITRTVYGFDSADEIILDVPLPPDVVTAINAKASAAGQTPAAWIAGAVEAALKAR